MAVLDDLASTTSAVAAQAGPAVVGIGDGWGHGSGVVVGDGVVLTNAHNVGHGPLSVTFHDGRRAEATLAGSDLDGDVAVVAVDTSGVAALEWSPTPAGIGAAVVALANPGGRGLRATFGQVSAVGQTFRGPRGRRVTGSFEHTAPLPRGSSGGPVVDLAGRMVGINVNRLGEGFYLALPADSDLRSRVDALAAGDSPPRAHLGLVLAPSRVAARLRAAVGLEPREGLLVQGVAEDGPAAGSGIRVGDLVVSAAGRPVVKVDDLHAVLDGLAGGDVLVVGLVRGVDELEVTVTFGATTG